MLVNHGCDYTSARNSEQARQNSGGKDELRCCSGCPGGCSEPLKEKPLTQGCRCVQRLFEL